MSNEAQQPTAPQPPKNLVYDEQALKAIVQGAGDLSAMTEDQRLEYYWHTCSRLGLDPMSTPFKFLRLNGRLVMYCDRSGAQQLNRLHKVSHTIRARETVNGCYVVTAHASTPDGRHTESIGAVTIDNLRGDNLCNAMMKAETKAKRRATLDLLGLGILDESETETIKGAQEAPIAGENDRKTNLETARQIIQEYDTENLAKLKKDLAAAKGTDRAKFFKRNYGPNGADALRILVKGAKEIKDIANLYYINAELVESLPELKQDFSNKKNEIIGHAPVLEA